MPAGAVDEFPPPPPGAKLDPNLHPPKSPEARPVGSKESRGSVARPSMLAPSVDSFDFDSYTSPARSGTKHGRSRSTNLASQSTCDTEWGRPKVSTFGCASRFAAQSVDNLKRLGQRGGCSPHGATYYRRNELYGSTSCQETWKPQGLFLKSARKPPFVGVGEKWVGPGAHDPPYRGKQTGMDGPQHAQITLKGKNWMPGPKRGTEPSPGEHTLPDRIGKDCVSAPLSKDPRFEREGNETIRINNVQYRTERDPRFGGSKAFLKGTFGVDARFRSSSKPDDRDCYYGPTVLTKDERLKMARSASFGCGGRKPGGRASTAAGVGPSTYAINRKPVRASQNRFLKTA